MKQIKGFDIGHLNNGAHFLFVANAHKRAIADAAVKDKVANELQMLERAVQEEDRILVTSQKSLLSDDIREADRKRDNIYRAIVKAVNAYMLFPNKETVEAAKVVKQLLKDYDIKITMQLDRETGLLLNLISDFENKYQTEIAKLGLTHTIIELKNVNDKLRGITEDRLHAKALVIIGNLKRARTASDEAYRTLVQKVNALAVVEGDAVYSTFIDQMNTEIKHYKEEALAHPKKKDDNKKPGEGNPKKPGDGKKPSDPKKPDDGKKPDDVKTPKPGREEDPGEDKV